MKKKNKTNKSVDVLKHLKKKNLKHKQMLGSSSSQLPKKTFFFFEWLLPKKNIMHKKLKMKKEKKFKNINEPSPRVNECY